jgi:hypothetical protein
MDHVFDQIRGVRDAGFPYAALMIGLSIPDICANLALGEGAGKTGQKARYQRWFDENLSDKLLLDRDDCYSIRCGFFHQGTAANKDAKFGVIVFSVGEPFTQSEMGEIKDLKTGQSYGRVLTVEVTFLTETIISAAQEWLAKQGGNPIVQRKLKDLMVPHANGYEVFEGVRLNTGRPCIA